jgi:hypothetical protein
VTRNKIKKSHNLEEPGPSKRKKKDEETPEKNHEDQNQQPDKDEEVPDDDGEAKVWKEREAASEEKSRDEEFQEYLEELLL